MSPSLVSVGLGPSEQLLGRDFSLRYTGGEGGLYEERERVERNDTKCVIIRPRGDGRRRGRRMREEDERGGGKISCHLHLMIMGKGFPAVFKYPFIGSTRTKWECRTGPEIA